MRAWQKDHELMDRLGRAGIDATPDDANTLRRAALTLSRWGEAECGNGSGWHIERDEATGKPRNVRDDTGKGYPCADREAGALRRIKATCERLGCHFYYQTDPRGWPLYLSREPMTAQNYSHGVGVGA